MFNKSLKNRLDEMEKEVSHLRSLVNILRHSPAVFPKEKPVMRLAKDHRKDPYRTQTLEMALLAKPVIKETPIEDVINALLDYLKVDYQEEKTSTEIIPKQIVKRAVKAGGKK